MKSPSTLTRKRVLWGLLGLVSLACVGLAIMGYLDHSWSTTMRSHDIVASSRVDSLTGARKDTTYLVPVRRPD